MANIKKIIKNLPTQISLTGAALLLTIADRGALILEEFLNVRRGGLRSSLKRIDRAKTFEDCYECLKNLSLNSARTILWRLKQKGLVKREGDEFTTTKLGGKIVSLFKNKIQEQPKWDGKWRMVFFDVPEAKRNQREWLYYQLSSSDYKPLQKSVFLGKFPLEENLMKEIINRDLYQYVRLITVGEIDDEKFLV